MTSWWVGKDRDAFNVALKDHTQRVMRRELPADRVPDAPPRPPAVHAPALEAVAAVARLSSKPPQRKEPRAWRPGSLGRIPNAVQPILRLASACREGILASEEAQQDPLLGRAAVVLLCGFLLRQDPSWIVPWTGYSSAEIARFSKNLRRYGVWGTERTLACDWMDVFLSTRRIPKRDRWTATVAFWLDALVGKGDVTRGGEPGDFRYGLSEWERKAKRA